MELRELCWPFSASAGDYLNGLLHILKGALGANKSFSLTNKAVNDPQPGFCVRISWRNEVVERGGVGRGLGCLFWHYSSSALLLPSAYSSTASSMHLKQGSKYKLAPFLNSSLQFMVSNSSWCL